MQHGYPPKDRNLHKSTVEFNARINTWRALLRLNGFCETEDRGNLTELNPDGSACYNEMASLRSQNGLVAALWIAGYLPD